MVEVKIDMVQEEFAANILFLFIGLMAIYSPKSPTQLVSSLICVVTELRSSFLVGKV